MKTCHATARGQTLAASQQVHRMYIRVAPILHHGLVRKDHDFGGEPNAMSPFYTTVSWTPITPTRRNRMQGNQDLQLRDERCLALPVYYRRTDSEFYMEHRLPQRSGIPDLPRSMLRSDGASPSRCKESGVETGGHVAGWENGGLTTPSMRLDHQLSHCVRYGRFITSVCQTKAPLLALLEGETTALANYRTVESCYHTTAQESIRITETYKKGETMHSFTKEDAQ